MNCEQIQQEILDRLAARETALPERLVAHQECCGECRSYYQSHVSLFHSINLGLGAIANSPVPPSLLPGVRARSEEQVAGRWFGFHGWTLAGLATAAMAAVVFALFWHRPMQPSNTAPDLARVTTARTPESTRDTGATAEAPKREGQSPRLVKQRSLPAPLAKDSRKDRTPEVIILAEEREAFARFAAQVPENPAAAVALTRRMPENNEPVVEIALLTIKPVEVKPLESSEE